MIWKEVNGLVKGHIRMTQGHGCGCGDGLREGGQGLGGGGKGGTTVIA